MNDPKALLMPVYTRGNEIERLRGALSLCCFFGAHLEVLHAQTKPSDLLEIGTFGLSAEARKRMIEIMDNDAIHEQQDLQNHFRNLCKQYNVATSDRPDTSGPTACWTEIEGARSELVAVRGRVNDLVIIPHSVSGKPTQTFDTAALHTGRPLLLMPRGMTQFSASKVIIGWNGSLEGARAVQHALPFIKRADSTLIVSSKSVVYDRPDGDELRNYFDCHGVQTDFKVIDDASLSPGELLLNEASEGGCDLLVTGGYTHTRLRQRVLGGVTQHMLMHAEIPVLMAH